MCENEVLVGELMYKIHKTLEKLRNEYVTALLQRLLRDLEGFERLQRVLHKESSEVMTWTKSKVQSLMKEVRQIVYICQESAKYIMGPLEKLDNHQCYNAIMRVKQRNVEFGSLADLITRLIDG